MDSTDKRILAVFAHPDDETTTSGGTLARYATEGAKVFVATATRGEQGGLGTGGYEILRDDLPAVRQAEMRSVLQELGTEPPIFLGYRDQEVSSADFEESVAEVETVMERVESDVVITWGPTGISGHDDHIAVHRATVRGVPQVSTLSGGGTRCVFRGDHRWGREDDRFRGVSPGVPGAYPRRGRC